MTPDAQGWVRCVRCGVWRRAEGVREVEWIALPGDVVARGRQCSDDAVCSRMAEVGKGELHGET